MTPTRIAIIGSGWAAEKHATALRDQPDVTIVGIASRNAEHAASLARRVGARAWTDHRRMLDAGGIDAVITCLPPSARGEPELAVIDRGLHLLVEKPLGLDRATPALIGRRIGEAGVIAAVGYQWRYLDLVDRARELLVDRPPQLVLGTWLGSTPSAEWWVRQVGSGGQVLEQATHILDLMRYLVGECQVVSAQAADASSGERGTADINDVSTTMLRFETGAIGTLATSRLLDGAHRVGLECFSTGQSLTLDVVPHRLIVGRATEVTEIITADDLAATYRAQDRAFIDAVQGRPVVLRSTWEDALRTHELALRASELAMAVPATIPT
jgi:myo-inositol 2-dehydrogenase/D-chiro-inositol 1-dehydrogenase